MSKFSENLKELFQFLKSKTFLIQIGIAIVGVFVFVFLLQWWLGITTNHNQKIQVPNLHKMSMHKLAEKLEELELDFVVIDSATFNPNYPKKSVLEQNPEAGNFVKEHRKIYITLNPSKYRDLVVPDLNGRTKRQATTYLRSMGFKVGEDVTYVSDIGEDVVRGLKYNETKIQPGSKLAKQSTINLILGDGKGN